MAFEDKLREQRDQKNAIFEDALADRRNDKNISIHYNLNFQEKYMQMKQIFQEGVVITKKAVMSFGVLLIGILDISMQLYTAQILKM